MCKDCRKRRAMPRSASVVQLCEDCSAEHAAGFFGKPDESFAEIRERQRAHYAAMISRYGYAPA